MLRRICKLIKMISIEIIEILNEDYSKETYKNKKEYYSNIQFKSTQ